MLKIHCKAAKCFVRWTPVKSVCMCVYVCLRMRKFKVVDEADVFENKVSGPKSKKGNKMVDRHSNYKGSVINCC